MNFSPTLTPVLIAATLAIMVWGFLQARKRGRASVLGWLQGLSLLLPWLLVGGAILTETYLSTALVVLLLVISTGTYVWLGQLTRQARLEEKKNNVTDISKPISSLDETMNSNPKLGGASVRSAGETVDPKKPRTIVTVESEPAKISEDDLTVIRSVFGIDTFYVTDTVPYGNGAILRGNLRKDATDVVPQLQKQLTSTTDGRYWLFLVYEKGDKPAMVVLPDETVNQKTPPSFRALAGTLIVATAASVLEFGANLSGFSLLSTPERWFEAAPLAALLIGILAAHEAAHRWMAQKYQVRLSPAFAVPALGLGTLGTLNRIESPVPSRTGLFDLAIAGPAVGGLLSLLLVILGLLLTGGPGDIFLPSSVFRFSIVMGAITKLFLGVQLQAEVVGIHPIVVMGYLGLGVSALSLLPAGQLDGGRLVQAMYGRDTARWTTLVTIIVLAIAAFNNQIALYWLLLIILIARDPERPPQDEITELDSQRDAMGLLALFLMALTLLPIAAPLAERIGIGG